MNRISILRKDREDRRLTGENFILQNGLSARLLRWDYLYGLSWIWEMLPGEWSDFDGWKRNFQEHEQAVKLAKNTAKSSVEAWGLECQKRGVWFAVWCYSADCPGGIGSKIFYSSLLERNYSATS